MPRPRRASRRRRHEGGDFVELVLGPTRRERRFVLRDAWFASRRDLMDVLPAGHRPWGWWVYEAGDRDDLRGEHGGLRESQPVTLARMGELGDDEIDELRADGYAYGGRTWETWIAVAGVLGLEPGRPSRLNAEELMRGDEDG